MDELTINPEVKQAWLEALRSGNYDQGTGNLHIGNTNEYCCLGVLCDVHKDQADKPGEWIDDVAYAIGEDRESMVLPPDVIEWAGLPDETMVGGSMHKWANPHFIPDEDDVALLKEHGYQHSESDYSITLATLNDREVPFAVIATMIEKHF